MANQPSPHFLVRAFRRSDEITYLIGKASGVTLQRRTHLLRQRRIVRGIADEYPPRDSGNSRPKRLRSASEDFPPPFSAMTSSLLPPAEFQATPTGKQAGTAFTAAAD